jgi:hypothetical protein
VHLSVAGSRAAIQTSLVRAAACPCVVLVAIDWLLVHVMSTRATAACLDPLRFVPYSCRGLVFWTRAYFFALLEEASEALLAYFLFGVPQFYAKETLNKRTFE